MFFKTNIHNEKIYTKNKQIIYIGISIILVAAIILSIFINIKKRDAAKVTDNIPDYVVTEYFIERDNDNIANYETRYYRSLQKTFLVLTEENDREIQDTVSEIESKFTHEFVDFTINQMAAPNVVDLTPYVDESGFIYTCELDRIEEFLASEVNQGFIRLANATPLYFECYIERKDGKINRGLVLYNSDLKTGTFMYKQCSENISIPSVQDIVKFVEKNNK